MGRGQVTGGYKPSRCRAAQWLVVFYYVKGLGDVHCLETKRLSCDCSDNDE